MPVLAGKTPLRMSRQHAVGKEIDVPVVIRAGPVQFLITLRGPLIRDDPAQIEPGTNHLVPADPNAAQQRTDPLEGVDGVLVHARPVALRDDLRTMDPRDVVVPSDHELLADALDLHLAHALPHAQGLDRQQLALARRLRDVARGRHFAAVKLADDLTALVDQGHVGHKDRLVDNRPAQCFPPGSRFGWCARHHPPAPEAWNRGTVPPLHTRDQRRSTPRRNSRFPGRTFCRSCGCP